MHITKSVVFKRGVYRFAPIERGEEFPLIHISGDSVVVDFNGSVIWGSVQTDLPDAYSGLAIQVTRGSHIVLKNVSIHGFERALEVTGVSDFSVTDADFSYNFREPLLNCGFSDSLDLWIQSFTDSTGSVLSTRAALQLTDCSRATVKNVRITEGQDGIFMHRCTDALLYNNTIQFNSGTAITLQQSTGNRFFSNRLDWNVGHDYPGTIGAGFIFCADSRSNILVSNSITHCSVGTLFLPEPEFGEAGFSPAVTFLVDNDFSYALKKGVFAFDGRYQILHNIFEGCRVGVVAQDAGYLEVRSNRFGNNYCSLLLRGSGSWLVSSNLFEITEMGVQVIGLEEKSGTPADLPLATSRLHLQSNLFKWVKNPLWTVQLDSLRADEGNQFYRFNSLWSGEVSPSVAFTGNFVHQSLNWGLAETFRNKNAFAFNTQSLNWKPAKLPAGLIPVKPLDAIDAFLPEGHPHGLEKILLDEWGPYNFQYPSIWLRERKDSIYVFEITGPPGNWQVVGERGFSVWTQRSGYMPSSLTAIVPDSSQLTELNLLFGGRSYINRFGSKVNPDSSTIFRWKRLEKAVAWERVTGVLDASGNQSGDAETGLFLSGYLLGQDTLWGTLYGGENLVQGLKMPENGFFQGRTTLDLPAGNYTIQQVCAGTCQLYLDGVPIVEGTATIFSREGVPIRFRKKVYLPGGRHTLEVTGQFSGGNTCLLVSLEPN